MESDITRIHQLIMKGQGGVAQRALIRLVERGVAREIAADIASLTWRANLPELGIRVLHPIVRPPPRTPRTASDEEKAEYAHCLIKYGAPDEGAVILSEIDERKLPRVLFYKVAVLVAQWNYKDSIPMLARYVRSPQLDPYQQLIGKVNLAAALVYVRDSRRAAPLLQELLYMSSLRGYELMLGRVLELTAEDFIQRKQWDKAIDFLREAEKRLKASQGIDEFFVRKFKAIVTFFKEKGDQKSLTGLRRIRTEAIERAHWETVRNCDRAEALLLKDKELLTHLYFGTPFPHYRERLVEDFGKAGGSLPDEYFWNPFGKGKPDRVLDLLSGKLDGAGIELLHPGSVLQRLVVTLGSDIYRPLRLASIHARLYPDRFFNPVTSPALIHDATWRLRKLFRDKKIPLVIEEKDGFYRITASAPFAIRISAQEILGQRYGIPLQKLRSEWPAEPFSIGQAVRYLGLPRRSTLRILQQAHDEGALERNGKARATRYTFKRTG